MSSSSSSESYSSDDEAASQASEAEEPQEPLDARAELSALEKKVNAKLALLDKIKAKDMHTCCWIGQTEFVRCHISFSSHLATSRERRALRQARKNLVATKNGGELDADRGRERRDAVEAAEKALEAALAKAAREAVNVVDDTEFGEGYRPLHYAAYAGHVETVRVLLDSGADPRARNDAGCTALFLAAQQGKDDVLRELLERTSPDWCEKVNLVPSGDGRMFCPLDVVRASDKAPSRAKTRSLLLETLKTRSRTLGRPQKPPIPPEVATDGATMGGIEVRWRPAHYELSGSDPPSQNVKIKVLTVEDFERGGANSASAAALVVAPAFAHRVRIPATSDDVARMGKLVPGRGYVAMIACVNGVGAGEYSSVSEKAFATEACRAAKVVVATEKKESRSSSPSLEKRLDPKVLRAQKAVREGREKRQRISAMILKAQQADSEREAKKCVSGRRRASSPPSGDDDDETESSTTEEEKKEGV